MNENELLRCEIESLYRWRNSTRDSTHIAQEDWQSLYRLFKTISANTAPKSTETDLVLALKSYQAVVETILSEGGGDITLWWDRLIDSQIGGAKAILECKSTEAEGYKEIKLTVEQCAEQFEMYAKSNPSKDSQHQLRFCAKFIRDFCRPVNHHQLIEAPKLGAAIANEKGK